MILTRTPLRISFCGGGSDLPAFYEHEDGATIGAAMQRYVYVAVKPEFTGRVLAHYRATEDVATVAELKHDRMRACLLRAGIQDSIEVTSMADVPGSTGLGSSSAFTVGLLHALGLTEHALECAALACQIEMDDLGYPIGQQDQYLTALGGLRFLQFHKDGSVEVDDVTAPPDFADHLLLLATPTTHDASAILAHQSAAMLSEHKRAAVRAMVEGAYAFRAALEAGDLRGCGGILDRAWHLKRSLCAGITTPAIDRWYERACAVGAWGGKLCGAGGGGFLLVMAPPERHAAIAQETGLRGLPVAFDTEGTRVLWAAR